MPGLLRGVARTAVVAGTATSVSSRVSRRQARRWGESNEQVAAPAYQGQQAYAPPPPPAPAPAPSADPVARLGELADLRDRGVLTDEEFAAAKQKVLQG